MHGKIARVVIEKGFGFVRGEDGVERFFHRSAVHGGTSFEALREGQEAEFEDEKSPKGPRARTVQVG